MNNLQEEINTTELNILYIGLINTTDIIENYAIRVIAIAGVILNFTSLLIVTHKDLKHYIYNYIWCRFFCNLIVCITGAGYVKNCIKDCNQSYFLVFYQWFLNGIPMKIALFSSAMSEIMIILNRVLILKRRNSFLKRISKLKILMICYLFPCLVAVPIYFAVNIYETYKPGIFMWEFNSFGDSIYFKAYILVVLLMETLMPLIILTVLNIISIKGYRTRNRSNIGLTNTRLILRRESENRITRMIMIMISLCIVVHLLDFISSLGQRIKGLNIFVLSDQMDILIPFFRQATFLIIFISHTVDDLLIFGMDKNLKKIVYEKLLRVRVLLSNLKKSLVH